MIRVAVEIMKQFTILLHKKDTPKGVYIGEWHSHLNKIPAPSPKDIESLFGISAAPNYLTRCPVLVITGLNPENKKVINMCSSVFPIGGRIYNIDYKIISREDLRKI